MEWIDEKTQLPPSHDIGLQPKSRGIPLLSCPDSRDERGNSRKSLIKPAARAPLRELQQTPPTLRSHPRRSAWRLAPRAQPRARRVDSLDAD
eukprot:6181478-Pleurochrysis_carterae.AAC.3